MSLTLADIDRWDPSAIRSVSEALGKRGASAADVRAGLSKLPLIATWQGSGGDAARGALEKLSRYLSEHADEMAAVSRATSAGADRVKAVKDALVALDDFARRERFAIDRVTGAVTPLDSERFDDPLYAMEQMNLEAGIRKLLADAAAVDAELARALTDGTDQPPIPVAPPPGGPPMSDAQIKSTIDEMLDGQDLSTAEAQRLSEVLNNELHAASSNGLDASNAYARAENAATSFMADLHRPYVRKSTRFGTFADAMRTPEGDLISDVTGDVIPAARDASGNLLWFDKNTFAPATEGSPNAMTIPERGYYHLGHEFGSENWRVLRQAVEENWTQQELNDLNQHGNYRVETPSENLSHAHEDTSPYAPNPDWTPQRVLDGASAGTSASGGTAPIIAPPPNLPGLLDHPPVALPPPNSPPLYGPAIPPIAPTPALPPWLTDPGSGHVPSSNPFAGPYGVTMDTPASVAAPPSSGGSSLPDMTPNISPQDAADAGGFLATVGAAGAAGLWVLSHLAHPFG
ncbi:hypothetical protein TUM20983_34800 [Mycobacterium antarcticum]|uniref:GH-E family nuclease n=1 Tax=Mycolicibacterium sp. TUM20983 TaxID=3023369 RepID=UPI0023A3DC1F|nr:GH-E family nuclease [Mycolicibacterium sp. TUM20983]GLP76370.1 hypothetical protein TUM20983_34800 [Mycolicibacterium sp. TUM20983]